MATPSLSLLPHEQRIQLRDTMLTTLLRRQASILGVMMGIALVVLYGSTTILRQREKHLDAQTKTIQDATIQVQGALPEQQIKKLNDSITRSAAVQARQVSWAPLVAALPTILPNGVRLTDVTITQATKRIHLTGIAATRDDLSKLQQVFTTGSYAHPTSPTSDILSRTDIPFDMEADIVLTP